MNPQRALLRSGLESLPKLTAFLSCVGQGTRRMRLFESFETLQFRSSHPVVYVVGFSSEGRFTPFYVGETGHLNCRYADYVRAQPEAPTDFRIGTAIKFLRQQGYEVQLKFRPSSEDKSKRRAEEKTLATELEESGYRLLKPMRARSGDKEQEARRIEGFVASLVPAGE